MWAHVKTRGLNEISEMAQDNASRRDALWRNALFGDPEGDSDMEAEEDDPSDPEGFTQEALNAK
ncbi:unnamed protein product [Miscanthus lutarioriparius]|uniref:Uncharacterized protein n=1 Tax=Miscanthus lutarioriparius TaxID=422564 RepID=A0A811PF44_9POAL|nr:unnamed protein product [Miscanthus lutarioriparius]